MFGRVISSRTTSAMLDLDGVSNRCFKLTRGLAHAGVGSTRDPTVGCPRNLKSGYRNLIPGDTGRYRLDTGRLLRFRIILWYSKPLLVILSSNKNGRFRIELLSSNPGCLKTFAFPFFTSFTGSWTLNLNWCFKVRFLIGARVDADSALQRATWLE